jgi:formamidopyrimidine-DNA glycosylase
MPELPEVETIVRSLRGGGQFGAAVIDRCIAHGQVLWEKAIAVPTAAQFLHEIVGRRVKDVRRRGKFIILRLDQGDLLVHLRMSGDIRVEASPAEREELPHDRVSLIFEDGARLVFNDPRKFGRLWQVDDAAVVVGGLGPEPLDDSLDGTAFFGMLHKHKRQLKPLLMDQSFLAGMGNIYTDEALHLARLHPLTRSHQVNEVQASRLLQAMRQVLRAGIRRNGASIDWAYRGGQFQNDFHVYQRTGEACPACGTLIERLVVGQRGTHICPQCQTLEPIEEGVDG